MNQKSKYLIDLNLIKVDESEWQVNTDSLPDEIEISLNDDRDEPVTIIVYDRHDMPINVYLSARECLDMAQILMKLVDLAIPSIPVDDLPKEITDKNIIKANKIVFDELV